MISPSEAQQFKTELLQARMNKPETKEEKKQEIIEKTAGEGAKMTAASIGAVDPLSQKAAALAGEIVGKQAYKHRHFIFGIIIFSIFFLTAILALSILSIWGYYCNNLATRVMMTLAGIKLKCP